MNKKLINKLYTLVLKFLKDPLFLTYWYDESYHMPRINRLTARVTSGVKNEIIKDNLKGVLWMFMEDMHISVVPYKLRRNAESKAHLIIPNDAFEKILADGIQRKNFHTSLTDAVTEFIRKTDQRLFHYGQAYYEINVEYNEDHAVKKLDLFDIYEPSMINFFGFYFQVVTWKAAKQYRIKAGVRRIPNKKILHIKFPDLLGGVKKRNEIVKTLIACGDLFPKFYLSKLKEISEGKSYFNSEKYAKSQYIEIAQVTKNIGWNQRKYNDENVYEYYSLHRQISLARSQAIIREHILAKLNESLKIQLGNTYSEIVFENLPKSEDINQLYSKLENGNLKFDEIYSKTI